MAIAERRSTIKPSLKVLGPSENAVLAILAGALLLLNILVGVMVHRALPNEPRAQTEEVIVSHGD
jgi:hypothetical protein